MRVANRLSGRGHQGYSLVEALIVVALIGIFSVIAVPNFIQLYQSSKLKSSMRNVTNDLRWARQMAVSETTLVIVSIPPPGATSQSYRFYRGRLNANGVPASFAFLRGPTGDPVVRQLDDTVFFSATTFTDKVDTTALRAADANYRDIVFLTNGTLWSETGTPQIQITSSSPIAIPTYNLNFSVAGSVKAVKP